jgi:hypothetical protein
MGLRALWETAELGSMPGLHSSEPSSSPEFTCEIGLCWPGSKIVTINNTSGEPLPSGWSQAGVLPSSWAVTMAGSHDLSEPGTL